MAAPLTDTHCHLDLPAFTDDLAQVVERAREKGLRLLLNPGVDLPSSRRAVELAQQDPLFRAGVGIHPHEAATFDATVELGLEDISRAPQVVAIGEIGLDYHYDLSPRDRQQDAFRRQLALARRLDLPVILHQREAQDDFISILRGEGIPQAGGVVHAFSGDWGFAQQCLDLGLLLGFGGMITFAKADTIREAAAQTPADRLVLETDAPYLTPVPLRGKRNEPALVELVMNRLATLRGISPQEVASSTASNASRLFRLPHLL